MTNQLTFLSGPILLVLVSGAVATPARGQDTKGQETKTCGLDELDLSQSTCGWRTVQGDRSIDGNALRVGGETYAHGVGRMPAVRFT